MTDTNQKQLGNTLWRIADQLRGAMDADDFRDYMLSFLFLRYLSDNYETAVGEVEIDLAATNQTLVDNEKSIKAATDKHNAFLEELGLPPLP
jgi:type I restriction enzyme M protein